MDVMNPPTRTRIAIVALLLAACGSPPTWQKTGASETVVQNDSEDCRVKARSAPLPERYISWPTSQSVTPQSITAPVLAREEQRAMFEADEFQKCMMAKGYTAKR
jgi:hypothetical protein